MKRIRNILRCEKALSYPLTIAIALSIVIVASAAFEYMRLLIIAQGVRDSLQSAIISVSTGNFSDVYASLREGHSGGFVNDGSGFREQFNTGDVYARLSELLGLQREGGYLVKYAGGTVEYRLSNLNIQIINAPFAPANRDTARQFLAHATIRLEVPLSFGWERLPPMRITIRCTAGWTPRF
ncbi:MAG: hypothetical protein FWC16_09560 [Defluviitaleaceae bacterium]|nr:hypothetical protein [Defluviitaleaceae bacterium]MCL2275159.1 hypothetical protein [Defluviitaleaceae bacterium]